MSDEEVTQIKEIVVYRNRFVTLYDDEVAWPSGEQGRYVRLASTEPGSGVVVIPQRGDLFGLVRVYRYPISSFQWGFPRGFAQGTEPRQTARAELHEEMGAGSDDFRILGYVTPDSGVQSSRVTVVHADVTTLDEPTDIREVSSTRWVRRHDLDEMIRKGDVEDAFTLAALFMLQLHLAHG